jgi:RNA-directed DNA polymerase
MRMYDIPKPVVTEAYRRVKANKGAAGVDNQTVADFEKNLENNLYIIWNRMSSGSYFPPAVRRVEIPKSDGKTRQLGIPTVGDRVAQMVAKIYLEPKVEPHFHEDSYGYRPRKSAQEAVGKARERCWTHEWVLDLDIKGFFDNLDHDLVMRAVKKHTDCAWLLLYIKRWLTAPVETADGQRQERTKGTPQGGVISPLLANLFLHHAFDEWMKKNHSQHPFERYADDVIVHCKTLAEAEAIKAAIEQRLKACHLELQPDKTRIVYCKRDGRKEDYEHISFDFLGYTFRPRKARNRRNGSLFVGFLPAISNKAKQKIREVTRQWQLSSMSEKRLEEIARKINPSIRGWINYYGKYYKTAMNPELKAINDRLVKWARKKYKKLRSSDEKARQWLINVAARDSQLFAHWQVGLCDTTGQ